MSSQNAPVETQVFESPSGDIVEVSIYYDTDCPDPRRDWGGAESGTWLIREDDRNRPWEDGDDGALNAIRASLAGWHGEISWGDLSYWSRPAHKENDETVSLHFGSAYDADGFWHEGDDPADLTQDMLIEAIHAAGHFCLPFQSRSYRYLLFMDRNVAEERFRVGTEAFWWPEIASVEQYAEGQLEGQANEYEQWCNGECYGYVVTRYDDVENPDGEEEDSCWGMIGYEDMMAEARRQAGIGDHFTPIPYGARWQALDIRRT